MKKYLLAAMFLMLGTLSLGQAQLPEPKINKEQAKDETPKPGPKPAVPVAVGKEPDERSKTPTRTADAPPTATDDDGMMPLTFVKNRLDNMKVGQVGYIGIETVSVDSKRRCFLEPSHIFGTKVSTRPILVRRDARGFHLTLEAIEHQWVAQELLSSVSWLPVKTVTAK